MPPKSKSNGGRSKTAPITKQDCSEKQPTRNWLELPSDIMLNILQRVGVFDRFENVQQVCTAWREAYKDPAMWRVIRMGVVSGTCRGMCKHAVDRSQRQLHDLTLLTSCNNDLLQYVVDRSSQLRRLEFIRHVVFEYDMRWSLAFPKIPLLEELSLVETEVSRQGIEAAGSCCPLLKTLKLNQTMGYSDDSDCEDNEESTWNDIALAIGKNLPYLTHLELIGNNMTNVGLQAILDGCCRLESLDLRRCFNVHLQEELGERCSQQVKCLKLPHDALDGYPYIEGDVDEDNQCVEYESMQYDIGRSNYYRAYDHLANSFDNLDEMVSFMNKMALI